MIDLDSLDGINIISSGSLDGSRLGAQQDEFKRQQQQPECSGAVDQQLRHREQEAQSCDRGHVDNLLTCMLITANVGTIFEESSLLDLWFQQLKHYLTKVRPQLVAMHCQEVGGKNYETSMKHASSFVNKILDDELMVSGYSRIRIFLDDNFDSLNHFTALGSLYLVHDSVRDVKLYNFKIAQYEQVVGRIANSDNQSTNGVPDHVEKVKFPPEVFPESHRSRKGYMRTRWLFNNSRPLDLVNIHLFHDASNLIAMETTPSPYAQTRQKALEYTLNRISQPLASQQPQPPDQVPLFIFGDFNFRLDTNKVIQRITEGASPVVKRRDDSDEVLEFIYHKPCKEELVAPCESGAGQEVKGTNVKSDDGNSNYIKRGGVVMTVGKKLFDCENLDETFRATKNCEWLQELDNELDSFKSKLYEFKISFSPSYPFKEDETGGYSYMKTRCPAWCDRILFNAAGGQMIHDDFVATAGDSINHDRIEELQRKGHVTYRLMGNSVPMGDHKPVLLYCQLNIGA